MALITITSGIGCGEMDIARLLKDKLGMEIFDDHRLQEVAVSMGVSSDELTGLDEKAPGLFSRLMKMKPQIYLDVLEAVVYQVSGQDEAIILGHGAPFLLRDFGCALHVCLYSSESFRIESLVDELDISPEGAKKLIAKSDNERSGFMQYAFRMDWKDPSLFDVIINRDKLGTEGAAQLIMAARATESISECSLTALDAMERLSLTKKVEAAIIKNCVKPENYHVSIEKEGIVLLSGIINPLESKEKLIDIIKAVPGVKEVRGHLGVERIHDI